MQEQEHVEKVQEPSQNNSKKEGFLNKIKKFLKGGS